MFTHLHTHTEYSLLDGLSKIEPLVQRAQDLGQKALAITDHGALYGALEFYQTAKKHDIKPIIGMEAYVAPGSRFDRDPKVRWPYHLTLLAQNETGYRNLLKLTSASHLEGFYYRPRLDRELLEKHNEGIIALSGCPSGEFMTALRSDDEEKARQVAGYYSDLFKGRYYLEVMEHGMDQFTKLMPDVFRLAKSLDLPTVLTNDSHYTTPEQHHAHDVLLCIGSNSTMLDANRFKLDSDKFYLRSEAEMRALFPDHPEAADNTWAIAESVDIKLQFDRAQLPDPGIPTGTSSRDYLRKLTQEGLRRRYGPPTQALMDRLNYELEVVNVTGFNEYMLIVRDIAQFAKSHGIPMGVRGSAASSIILYTLDVTDIEPLQYGLVFERFLNPERIGMPDVDFDFADDRREEVIRYTAEKYGREHVAQICTFGTLGAKAAIRDSGRALGLDFGAADRIARMIPETLNISIDEALNQSSDLKNAYADESTTRDLLDTARSLEGVARHASTHAAGIVISREPLTDVVPLQRATKKDADEETALPTTQYAMAEIDKIGLLKIDYLGLTNLTILGHAVELIERQRGERVDLLKIPDSDPDTAAILSAGETFGVFQMESAGMRRYVVELKPQNIRELSAMVALFRPGPLEHIPTYIDTKHGRAKVHYLHPDLEPILAETYGVITYQEQVLQIARKFAGYSLGQADVMRKAMGKKIASVMLEERKGFLEGAAKLGYEQRLAEQIFDQIEPFAGYAFNKAHAVCYGTIAYQTAYLKAHYPVEYMAAVLQAANGNSERVAAGIAECTRLGVPVLPPDVNRSEANFSIEQTEDGVAAIRFGLAQIKNVGLGGVEGLIADRDAKGDFATVEDFARRINARDLNKRVLDSLAKAGALDSMAPRAAVIGGVDRILSLAQQEQRLRETGQTSMFDLFGDEVNTPLPGLELTDESIPQPQILAWEKEVLGTYVSGHPFQTAAQRLAQWVTHQSSELTEELGGQEAVIAGTVVSVRSLSTKNGKPFAALTLEDLSGQVELTVWNTEYETARSRGLLFDGVVLLAKVGVRPRGDRLTVAAVELCAYDYDAGQLAADFAPARFVMRTGVAATRVNGPAGPRPLPTPPGTSPTGPGGVPGGPRGARPDLRIVPSGAPDETFAGVAENEATYEPRAVEPRPQEAGPRRLVVAMDETTDEGADRRRIGRVCAALDEYPGDLPVELHLRLRAEGEAHLARGGVDPARLDILLPRLKALLGVLGEAHEIGVVEAAPTLAAVGAV